MLPAELCRFEEAGWTCTVRLANRLDQAKHLHDRVEQRVSCLSGARVNAYRLDIGRLGCIRN